MITKQQDLIWSLDKLVAELYSVRKDNKGFDKKFNEIKQKLKDYEHNTKKEEA